MTIASDVDPRHSDLDHQRTLSVSPLLSPAAVRRQHPIDDPQAATELAEAVHPGPFRATRQIIRGELAAKLRDALAADLAAFSVEPG